MRRQKQAHLLWNAPSATLDHCKQITDSHVWLSWFICHETSDSAGNLLPSHQSALLHGTADNTNTSSPLPSEGFERPLLKGLHNVTKEHFFAAKKVPHSHQILFTKHPSNQLFNLPFDSINQRNCPPCHISVLKPRRGSLLIRQGQSCPKQHHKELSQNEFLKHQRGIVNRYERDNTAISSTWVQQSNCNKHMTTISFTFKFISPRKANSSYLWAHGRWWHTRSQGWGGCIAGGASSCAIKLVLTLQSKWSSQALLSWWTTNPSCWHIREPGQKAKHRPITNGQNVPLPP